jgi:hypothetical protein
LLKDVVSSAVADMKRRCATLAEANGGNIEEGGRHVSRYIHGQGSSLHQSSATAHRIVSSSTVSRKLIGGLCSLTSGHF